MVIRHERRFAKSEERAGRVSANLLASSLVHLPARGPWPHAYFETASETLSVSFRDTEGRDWRIATHQKVAGSGKPLVLIHGLMTSSYSFRYVIADLAKRYRVFVPDLVGAGASEKPVELAYTIANVGRFIAAYVRALGVGAPYVVGNSLGGLHAAKAILDEPGTARRFLLMHSPGYPMLRTRLGLPLLGLARGPVAKILHAAPRLVVSKNVHYANPSILSIEEVNEYAKLFATREGCRVFVRILRESLDPREQASFMEELRKKRPFPCPVLCLFARKDALVPPAFGPRWAEDLGAPLRWVDDASHFIHVDRPQVAIDEILAFDKDGS